jgi:uncharacterized protein
LADLFARTAAWAARRARWVVAFAVLVAIAAGVGATRIPTDAGVGTFVDSGNATYEATEHVREVFGEEPVVVLVKGELPQLLLTKDIFRLLRLEGCLSGKVPKGASALPGACRELAESGAVEFVSGPATFLNEAVVQIDRQLRRLSKEVAPAELQEFLLAVATKYGITSLPSIDNEQFVATVVFDLARARGTPKARLAYLFPNSHTAQIIVRLKPDLTQAERHRAIGLIEDLVAETTPRKQCAEGGKAKPCFVLSKGSYVVSGAPVVVDGLSRALKDALLLLFGVALVVMAVVLLLVFRSRLRLLPLALAVAATAIAFAIFGLANGSLTMASIAALPILIGLAVDYAIQFQARFDEATAAGAGGVEAARAAARAGAPTIAAACIATAAGFLALQLSPTPMVRGFGWLLIVGVGVAFALALTVGLAALALGSAAPGALFSDSEKKAPRAVAWTLGLALEQPAAVLGVGLALAILGWGLGTRVSTVSDIRDLAPQSLHAVKGLDELQEATGVSGELDVSIEAPDLSDPATIEWMAGFKRRVLRENGFKGEDPSCLTAEVCPGPALSDFLTRGEGKPTRAGIDATLAALSSYDLRQVAPLEADGKIGHSALISFGIRAQSLEDQQRLVDRVRAAIGEPGQKGGPPPGVEVHLAGLAVIAAESASDLSSSRYWLALGGLVAVAIALLLVYRSPRRALVPLVPTVLATGWASLLLWLTGIPLNPMSAALGALTIAVGTEFAVILSGRFHQEQAAHPGGSIDDALGRAYARTGAAVLASGLTAIAGFAVLIASDIQMLRDFGVVTVIDLLAALLGVLIVLPAALVVVEER